MNKYDRHERPKKVAGHFVANDTNRHFGSYMSLTESMSEH